MKNDSCRLNLTVKKSSLDVFRSQAESLNLRPGAFFDVLMGLLGSDTEDAEKLVGKFILEVIRSQSK